MFTLKIMNDYNSIFTLTQNESNYQVINIDGLNPPKANIYTSNIAEMDGAKFKSSKVEMRNIVITVKINGNVEENRQQLYTYFRLGKWCKIYYKNENRDVFIEGYVETLECGLFTNSEVAQISIVCPQPYFKSVEEIITDLSTVINGFKFPFSIDSTGIQFSYVDVEGIIKIVNRGEIETGLIVKLTASGNVVNPVVYNHETGAYFKINKTLVNGDEVVINMNRGSKSIILNNTTNIMQYRDLSSTWLTLDLGSNYFSFNADSGKANLKVEFIFNESYGGV